jgi:hypothetical protein
LEEIFQTIRIPSKNPMEEMEEIFHQYPSLAKHPLGSGCSVVRTVAF